MMALICSCCPDFYVLGGFIGLLCRSDGSVDSFALPIYFGLGAISEHLVVRMMVLIRSTPSLAIGLARGEVFSKMVRDIFPTLCLLLVQLDFVLTTSFFAPRRGATVLHRSYHQHAIIESSYLRALCLTALSVRSKCRLVLTFVSSAFLSLWVMYDCLDGRTVVSIRSYCRRVVLSEGLRLNRFVGQITSLTSSMAFFVTGSASGGEFSSRCVTFPHFSLLVCYCIY